jgi:hypothetical protein
VRSIFAESGTKLCGNSECHWVWYSSVDSAFELSKVFVAQKVTIVAGKSAMGQYAVGLEDSHTGDGNDS